MKKWLLLIALLVLPVSFVTAKDAVYTGYLSDVLCGSTGYLDGYKGNEKFNLTVSPEKNNVMCLTMANCKATGYGIFIKQSTGKYKFYKFDKKGSDMALTEILSKMTNQMEGAPLIEITGDLKGDTITVKKIKRTGGTSAPVKGHKM